MLGVIDHYSVELKATDGERSRRFVQLFRLTIPIRQHVTYGGLIKDYSVEGQETDEEPSGSSYSTYMHLS